MYGAHVLLAIFSLVHLVVGGVQAAGRKEWAVGCMQITWKLRHLE